MPLASQTQYHQYVFQIYTLLIGIVLLLVLQIVCTYYVKEAYYILILSGQA